MNKKLLWTSLGLMTGAAVVVPASVVLASCSPNSENTSLVNYKPSEAAQKAISEEKFQVLNTGFEKFNAQPASVKESTIAGPGGVQIGTAVQTTKSSIQGSLEGDYLIFIETTEGKVEIKINGQVQQSKDVKLKVTRKYSLLEEDWKNQENVHYKLQLLELVGLDTFVVPGINTVLKPNDVNKTYYAFEPKQEIINHINVFYDLGQNSGK